MLEKISTAANSNESASADKLKDNDAGKGRHSSQKVFKSLLMALQGDGSSAKDQLLKETSAGKAEASSEKAKGQNILGGKFSDLKTEKSSKEEELPNQIQQSSVQSQENKAPKAKGNNSKSEQGGDSEQTKQDNVKNSALKKQQNGSNISSSTAEKKAQKQDKANSKQASSTGKTEEEAKKQKTTNEKNGSAKGKVSPASVAAGDAAPQNSGKTTKAKSADTTDTANKSQKTANVNNGSKAKRPAGSKAETAKLVTGDASTAENSSKDSSTDNSGGKASKNKQKDARAVKTLLKFGDNKSKPQLKVSESIPQQQQKAANTNGQNVRLELNEKQKRLIDNFSQKNGAAGFSGKGAEMKSVKLEKMRKKKSGNDEQTSEGRNNKLSSPANYGRARRIDSPLPSLPGTNSFSSDSGIAFDEQQIKWESLDAQTSEGTEEKNSGKTSGSSSTMKLGQIPITNASLRKKILPGLTKSVLKAASEAQKSSQQWQKHNFTLDDGKNIQLSVRETKGVLQVKMGSMNIDLSKFLQQNLQQIRDHLKQEFGSDVDLQFENQGQGGTSEFSEDSAPDGERRKGRQSRFLNDELTSESAGQVAGNSVRNFGYNQMEWMA